MCSKVEDLSVDVLPLFTAADTLVQSAHAWLDITSKDTIQVDLFTASTDDLVTQLNTHQPCSLNERSEHRIGPHRTPYNTEILS